MGGLLVLLGGGARPAAAAESARDFLVPTIDRTQYAIFCRRLGLDREQQLVADLVFGDYQAALAQLIEEVDQRAEEAGRRTVAEAVAGRRRVAAEELKRLRLAPARNWRG